MNITIHRTPQSTGVLVQVTNRGYNEHLLVSGNLVTSDLFSMSPQALLTAEKHTTRNFWANSEGKEISVAELQKEREAAYEQFGITKAYGVGEDDEENLVEFSSQFNGVTNLNKYMTENFPYRSAPVIEEVPITITENVAKDLGEFITPLTNASGIPEIALYSYDRHALRASYFPKFIKVIVERQGIISSQYPQDEWSIFYYVVQGDKLNSIAAQKGGSVQVIGNEEMTLKSKAADVAFYEAKLQDLRSQFAPEGTNKVIKNHLEDLIKLQDAVRGLEVKSKSHRDWDNLQTAFTNVLNSIRKEANV